MFIGKEAFFPAPTRQAAKELFARSVERVEVETHSYCNRRCDYCPNSVGDRLGENRRMPNDIWYLLLDNLREINYASNFIFTSYNEPLADGIILQRIREMREYIPNARAMVYSNGDYLKPDFLAELANAGLDYLHISIHTRPGDKYSDTHALNHIAKLVRRMQTPVHFQAMQPREFIFAKVPHPKMEIEIRAINYWQHGTDRGGLLKGVGRKVERSQPCHFPFVHFHMGFEGTIVPCCHIRSDTEEHKPYRYGNLRDFGSIFEAYACRIATDWRRHLSSSKAKQAPCNTCIVPFLNQSPDALEVMNGAWKQYVASPPSEATPSQEQILSLGNLYQKRNFAKAVSAAMELTREFPQYVFFWKILGAALKQTGKSAEALEVMRKTTLLAPNDPDAYNNLGVALKDLGELPEAIQQYRRALEIQPRLAETWLNLGNALYTLGELEEAETSCLRAIQINPDLAEAHINLGNIRHDLGNLDVAEANYLHALELSPTRAEAHNNLGITLKDQNRLDEAEDCFLRALAYRPKYADALNNLALLLIRRRDAFKALGVIRQSLAINETQQARSIFVDCIKHLPSALPDPWVEITLTQAILSAWGKTKDLARIGIEYLMLDPYFAALVERTEQAWWHAPSSITLEYAEIERLAANPLLIALLDTSLLCDARIERFLTSMRHYLLRAFKSKIDHAERIPGLKFYSALARQCFFNEYVYVDKKEEYLDALMLRDALEARLAENNADPIPPEWPVVVGAYFPLHALCDANRLLKFAWPSEVMAVLTQQIVEPQEEATLRKSIPTLSPIANEISQRVRDQYEQNPYPRWVSAGETPAQVNLQSFLRQKFPLAGIRDFPAGEQMEILIAGCGTGQHSIKVARQFPHAKILAIDLSLSSLSYAMRKTREQGIESITYAQADLLQLGTTTNRRFDIIESVGVLHHMADPWVGWHALLGLLRPAGFMRLGFYSEFARRHINSIRQYLADRQCDGSADEIRRYRQVFLAPAMRHAFGNTFMSPDFYSLSACRDLLFHVQEHHLTLARIDNFLQEHQLSFLGFEAETPILQAYRHRHTNDAAAIRLDQWHHFEQEQPDLFHGMYQFWIQKPSDAPAAN